MEFHAFCLCALAVFGVTHGQNPEVNNDITPKDLLENTHTHHKQFAGTIMLPLLKELDDRPALISEIQSKGLVMKASHGTESEFHLNYNGKIRSNIASMKVRHSATSEFELKPSFPSTHDGKSSTVQTAGSSPAQNDTDQDASSSSESDKKSSQQDESTSVKQNKDTQHHKKADSTPLQNTSSKTEKTHPDENVDNTNGSSLKKNENKFSDKVDKNSKPEDDSSSSEKDGTKSLEKDKKPQGNSSPQTHTLHIVVTHVFHSSQPLVPKEFYIESAVPLIKGTHKPEVITSTTEKTYKLPITLPGNLIASNNQLQLETQKLDVNTMPTLSQRRNFIRPNFKEASNGMYKQRFLPPVQQDEYHSFQTIRQPIVYKLPLLGCRCSLEQPQCC